MNTRIIRICYITHFHILNTAPDHRVTGRCTYQLPDLLTIALLT